MQGSSQSPNPQTGRAFDVKVPWVAWLGLVSLSSVWLLQAC